MAIPHKMYKYDNISKYFEIDDNGQLIKPLAQVKKFYPLDGSQCNDTHLNKFIPAIAHYVLTNKCDVTKPETIEEMRSLEYLKKVFTLNDKGQLLNKQPVIGSNVNPAIPNTKATLNSKGCIAMATGMHMNANAVIFMLTHNVQLPEGYTVKFTKDDIPYAQSLKGNPDTIKANKAKMLKHCRQTGLKLITKKAINYIQAGSDDLTIMKLDKKITLDIIKEAHFVLDNEMYRFDRGYEPDFDLKDIYTYILKPA